MTAPPGAAPQRDRDKSGRPLNSRPRDGLGRPLARGATGEPTVSPDLALPPAAALILAQQLLDAGRPFHAHEVLEATWKSAPAGERDLWQGLAQLAVGLTHALRGNPGGAVRLLRRGTARISGYAPGRPHGVDVAGVSARAADLASRIERAGVAALADGELRLTLTAP
jgi:hypothetical protein